MTPAYGCRIMIPGRPAGLPSTAATARRWTELDELVVRRPTTDAQGSSEGSANGLAEEGHRAEATEAQDRVLGARLQYRRGTDRRGAEEPHRHQRLAERGSRAELLERYSRRLRSEERR